MDRLSEASLALFLVWFIKGMRSIKGIGKSLDNENIRSF